MNQGVASHALRATSGDNTSNSNTNNDNNDNKVVGSMFRFTASGSVDVAYPVTASTQGCEHTIQLSNDDVKYDKLKRCR